MLPQQHVPDRIVVNALGNPHRRYLGQLITHWGDHFYANGFKSGPERGGICLVTGESRLQALLQDDSQSFSEGQNHAYGSSVVVHPVEPPVVGVQRQIEIPGRRKRAARFYRFMGAAAEGHR